MNYLKSEAYRMHRKKGLYLTSAFSLSLVLIEIFVLVTYQNRDHDPSVTTNAFLYSSVFRVIPFILLIGFLFGRQLLGQDKSVIKQSIPFGISRNRIFFTKLFITLMDFILLCLIGILVVIIGGEFFLTAQSGWKSQFIIGAMNLAPLVMAAFIMGYTLMLLLGNELISVLITLFFYNNFFEEFLRTIDLKLFHRSFFSDLIPHAFIEKNVDFFMEKHATLSYDYWLYSLIIIGITLAIALPIFNKKDI